VGREIMNNIIKSENVIMQGKTTEKTDIHKEICGELNKIYEAKNKDYGDSFAKLRKEYGNPAILIRLEDKLGRLKRLMLSGEQNVKVESIEDTLIDLANYAIMELVERQIERDLWK
jgi:hypothetical protein